MSENITNTTTIITKEDESSITSIPLKITTENNQCELKIDTLTQETEIKTPNFLTILKNTMIPLTVSNVDLNSVNQENSSQPNSIKIINSNLFLDRIINNEMASKRDTNLSDSNTNNNHNNNGNVEIDVEVKQRKNKVISIY